MSIRRVTLACAVGILALATGCGGCTDRGKVDAGDAVDAGADDEREGEGFLGSGVTNVHTLELRYTVIGQEDPKRYTFTVVYSAAVPTPDGPDDRGCNGVLFASNLVLTAAHCVCEPGRGETSRFDGSRCASKAEVRVLDDPLIEERTSGIIQFIKGSVLIHPQFEMTLDAQGDVASSRADLAIIRLDSPAPPSIRPVRIAEWEVRTGEVLSVVGFGYEERVGGLGLGRFFKQEKVRMSDSDDRMLFWSMDDASYKGDRGGPCLRETRRGSELVGISERGLGLKAACTRIVPYRGWLEEQIRLASERH